MFNRPRPKPSTPPSRSRSGASIKLPQLWSSPAMENIADLLAQALKNHDTFIEQMWSVEGLDKMFVLNCRADDEGDPLWVLKETRLTDTKLLWEHRSRDTALIHTLVMGECTGEVVSESKDTQEFSTNINLNIGSDDTTDIGQEESGSRESVKTTSHLHKLDHDDAILQGDLTKIQLPMVMQSIQMGKMTGRLAIRTESSGVDVYFSDGDPLHATDGVDKGDEVILNLICLKDGKFQFIPDERTVEASVTQKLDSLLMESISMVDQSNFLEKEGLTDACYLISKHSTMPEPELQSALAQGVPVDINLQYEFMRGLDSFKPFSEQIAKSPLKRSQWIPILFNLVTLGIVSIADTPPQETGQVQVEEEEINYEYLESSIKPITRPETGVLIYPAFQYFLAQECYRFKLCGMPVSLAVFSINLEDPEKELTNLDVFEIMTCITKMKRPIDILGHFQTFEYAIALPNMGCRTAANVVNKIQATMPTIKFKSGISPHDIRLDFGIAGIPEHCSKLGQIIPAASQARKRAETSSANVVLYEA